MTFKTGDKVRIHSLIDEDAIFENDLDLVGEVVEKTDDNTYSGVKVEDGRLLYIWDTNLRHVDEPAQSESQFSVGDTVRICKDAPVTGIRNMMDMTGTIVSFSEVGVPYVRVDGKAGLWYIPLECLESAEETQEPAQDGPEPPNISEDEIDPDEGDPFNPVPVTNELSSPILELAQAVSQTQVSYPNVEVDLHIRFKSNPKA